jgi:hypothetical protein
MVCISTANERAGGRALVKGTLKRRIDEKTGKRR